MQRPKVKQKEAYCLMQYVSDKPSRMLVMVWNTRDGITPFMFHIEEGREFQHTDFHSDKYHPDYVPCVGDYVFVDLTLERAVERRLRFVEKWWNEPIGEARMSDRYKSREDAIEKLSKMDAAEFGGAPPCLLKVTEDWLKGFRIGRGDDVSNDKFKPIVNQQDWDRGYKDGRRNATGPLPTSQKTDATA